MDASTKTTSPTTILDLNDDCMQEIFKYLDLFGLCNVADVSIRFRQNAQAYFANSEYKDFSILNPEYEKYATDWLRLKPLLITLTPRVLRNFGPFIRSIVVSNLVYRNLRPAHEVFNMIDRYCSEALVRLQLEDYILSNKRLALERSLFRHIQKLTLQDCDENDSFLRNLPSWSPNLRELELIGGSYKMIFRLNQTFPNLVAISMVWCNVTKNDLEEFLKCNSQLKKIVVKHCIHIDGSIFQSIAEYVSEIEEIRFVDHRKGNGGVSKYLGFTLHSN